MQWTKRAIRQLVGALEQLYGRPRFIPRFDPLEELICCILTQHSTDARAFPTFTALRERYPTWSEIEKLSQSELANAIRKAGLPNQKAKSILAVLREIKARNGEYTLDGLRGMSLQDGRRWLMSLQGVGPKTAAIVLLLSFGKPAIPVDTHVFRVCWRLGLIDKKIGEAKAHDVVAKMVPEELAYRFHVALIQHGRQTCKAPIPRCEICVVREKCWWYGHEQGSAFKRVGGRDKSRASRRK